MRFANYLRFCALLALVVLAASQPRTRREREAEQAAADAAANAPPAMTWAKPDAPPAAAPASLAVAAPAPSPAKAAAAPAPAAAAKPAKDAPKGAVKGFIRVSGNKFVDEKCGDFIPIGWNCELVGERGRALMERARGIDGSARTGQKRERGERSAVAVNSRGCLRDGFFLLPLIWLN